MMNIVLVTSKDEVFDILEDNTTIHGMNPDLTVYRCETEGDEAKLADLPEDKKDVTSKVAVKKGDEMEGVTCKDQLNLLKMQALSAES